MISGMTEVSVVKLAGADHVLQHLADPDVRLPGAVHGHWAIGRQIDLGRHKRRREDHVAL